MSEAGGKEKEKERERKKEREKARDDDGEEGGWMIKIDRNEKYCEGTVT